MPPIARANILDGFEGGRERWQLWDNDTNCQIRFHQIVVGDAHSGATSELVEVACQNGSYTYLVYPIPPAAIIHDLRASAWVRCVSSGMSLGFRVVFPNALDPATGRPIARAITGSRSKGAGNWSLISIGAPDDSLGNVQRVILHQYPNADLRGAYIDAVVLNCYTGPGVVKFQIDDLTVEPLIDAQLLPAPSSRIDAEQQRDLETLAAAQISERKQDIRSSVPRWLQYNGEDLYRLRSTGFTGIVLNRAPDARLVQEAQQLQLDIVAPPPTNVNPNDDPLAWNGVSVWLLGAALNSSQIESSRNLSQRVARLPTTLLRPVLAEPLEQPRSFSRFADLLAVPFPYASTVKNGIEQTVLVGRAFSETRAGTLNIVSFNTESMSEWEEQSLAAMRVVNEPTLTQTGGSSLDLLQSRLQLYRSIAAGAHGWFFRSQQNLDTGTPLDDARRNHLQSINAELSRLAPWIQSAQPPSAVSFISSKGYLGTVHTLPTAKLIILQATGEHDVLCPTAPNLPELTVHVTPQAPSNQVRRISNWYAEAVKFQTVNGVVQFTIPNPNWVELIVITSDPTVLEFLERPPVPRVPSSVAPALANLGPVVTEARMEIANQLYALANRTLIAEQVPPTDPAWSAVENAQTQIRNAMQYVSRSDFPRTIAAAEQSAKYSQSVIRASWERAMERQRFDAPQSSPWMCSPLSLPLHWQLTSLLGNRTWQTLAVPGGDMNDSTAMRDLGWVWEKNPRLADVAATNIEVIAQSGPDSSPALHLAARPATGQSLPGGYPGAALIVRSPKMIVPSGNMVRIDGMIRVISASQVPQAGLLVYDNIIGPAFGQLVTIDPTRTGQWQRFSLFRMLPAQRESTASPQDAPSLRILFEVRGEGDYLIDQLNVSTIAPSPYPAYPVSPYQEDGVPVSLNRADNQISLEPGR